MYCVGAILFLCSSQQFNAYIVDSYSSQQLHVNVIEFLIMDILARLHTAPSKSNRSSRMLTEKPPT